MSTLTILLSLFLNFPLPVLNPVVFLIFILCLFYKDPYPYFLIYSCVVYPVTFKVTFPCVLQLKKIKFSFSISFNLLSLFFNFSLHFPNPHCFKNVLSMPTFFPSMSLLLIISSLSSVPSLLKFYFYISVLVCHHCLLTFPYFFNHHCF